MSEGRIALFDMDGTLFDYDGQMKFDLHKLRSPDEPNPMLMEDLWAYTKQCPYLKERMELIKQVPGWWKGLPKLKLGWDIYHLANSMGFCCHILTKGPRSKSRAWAEKVECINEHFGEDMPIDIVSGESSEGSNKKHRYGRVLVDDFPDYMLGWLKHRKRGLGIMPEQPCNAGFKHPNVVKYDGTDITMVDCALRAAYGREPNQHWKDCLSQQWRERFS